MGRGKHAHLERKYSERLAPIRLTYRRLVSAANGATESATALAGRRGDAYSGIGGRCSSVPNKGASSTPTPKDTNWSAAHMDSTRRRWREVSTLTGRV